MCLRYAVSSRGFKRDASLYTVIRANTCTLRPYQGRCTAFVALYILF